MVNHKLLQEYIYNFFGYGNLKSKMWFVGMEEGSSGEESEILERISLWQKQGMGNTIDIKAFHQELYKDYFFNEDNTENVKSQATWRGIIRTILGYLGENDDIRDVKLYQNNELGKLAEGKNCILELFPLPSVNITNEDFNKTYKTYLNEGFFKANNISNKSDYRDVLEEQRINKLNEFIDKNKPYNVIFYGVSYYDYWVKIIPGKPKSVGIKTGRGNEEREIYYFQGENTNFYIMPHTTATGLTKIFFKELGQFIKSQSV